MKTLALFLALASPGCASAPVAQVPPRAVQAGGASQGAPEVVAAGPVYFFHFVYPVQFTHWVLQSSTNLYSGWHNRDDATFTTNDDGSILAHLPLDPSNAQEFYRVVGDTI